MQTLAGPAARQDAFGARLADLYKKRGKDYLRIIRRRLSGTSVAPLDVLHDALVVALSCWERFDEAQELEPWLQGIMNNLCLRRLRQAYRGETPVDDVEAMSDAVQCSWLLDVPTPETHYHLKSLCQRMQLVIDALPAESRRTFLAAVIDGMAYAEVAQDEGVDLGTVRSRIARARQRLRAAV
jgi:RNA polymerase sigma-70 factor (ECF subfamily)